MKCWNAWDMNWLRFLGNFAVEVSLATELKNCLLLIFQQKLNFDNFSFNFTNFKWLTTTVNAQLQQVSRQCMEGKYFR
jgi:hypothetical protein